MSMASSAALIAKSSLWSLEHTLLRSASLPSGGLVDFVHAKSSPLVGFDGSRETHDGQPVIAETNHDQLTALLTNSTRTAGVRGG